MLFCHPNQSPIAKLVMCTEDMKWTYRYDKLLPHRGGHSFILQNAWALMLWQYWAAVCLQGYN